MLLNLIKHQRPEIDKIYLYAKDPFKSKYQLLVNRREKTRIKELKMPKDLLIIHIQLMIQHRKEKGFIVFDDIIADMEANKN